RRQLDRRAREHEGSQGSELVRGLSFRREQRRRRQIADIAVGLELAPGPAFLVGLVDRHALAVERFGDKRAVVRRKFADRHDADDNLLHRAFGEAPRLDLAAQMLGGKVGTRRRDARVEAQRISLSPTAPWRAWHRRRGYRPPAGRAPSARYWRRAPARSSCRWRASGSPTGDRSRSRW